MAEDDRIRDIFGSESEDNDDHHLDEKPAIPNSTEQNDFGDDDDEADVQPARQRQPTPPESPSPSSPGPSPARPMFVKVPLHDTLDPTELRLAKLSNILGLEPKPFDPSTFELDEDHHGSQATIRWRWASDAQGNLKIEGNARIVRWSDGSAQLFLGEDVLELKEIDISDDNNYIFARHSNLMQGMGQLLQKTVFHPTGLASTFHQRLKGQVQKHNLPKSRVKATTTLVDPNKLNLEREQAEEQRIRDKERLLDRQQKAMRRYGTGGGDAPGRAAPRGGLSTAFLEEADYGDEDEYGVNGGGGGGGRRGPMGEEEEAEAERRLREAKAVAVASLPRSGAALEDEDEDEDEDEMRDFIVDDEDEEEKKKGRKRTVGDEDDEESSGEEDGGEKKGEEKEEEEGKPAAKRQRGAVIIDSDSE